MCRKPGTPEEREERTRREQVSDEYYDLCDRPSGKKRPPRTHRRAHPSVGRGGYIGNRHDSRRNRH